MVAVPAVSDKLLERMAGIPSAPFITLRLNSVSPRETEQMPCSLPVLVSDEKKEKKSFSN